MTTPSIGDGMVVYERFTCALMERRLRLLQRGLRDLGARLRHGGTVVAV